MSIEISPKSFFEQPSVCLLYTSQEKKNFSSEHKAPPFGGAGIERMRDD